MIQKEYGPLTLPKSGTVIYFREPVGGDRLDILKNTSIGTENFVSQNALTDLYLSAKCISKVDGVTSTGDYKYQFNNWPSADVDYYQQVFNKMFTVSKEAEDKIDQVADFLLNGSTSSSSSTSTTSAEAPLAAAVGSR